MLLTSNECKFLCKEVRQSKNKPENSYYLYTFMCDGQILPAFYSTEDIKVDGLSNCTLELETSVFNNRLNFKLKGINVNGK